MTCLGLRKRKVGGQLGLDAVNLGYVQNIFIIQYFSPLKVHSQSIIPSPTINPLKFKNMSRPLN